MKLRLVAACLVAALVGGIALNARERPQALVATGSSVGLDDLRREGIESRATETFQQEQTERHEAGEAYRAKIEADKAAARREAARREATVRAAVARRPNRGSNEPRQHVQASGDLLDRLAACESGGGVIANINPRAVSKNRTYWGAFQFSLTTWHSFKPGNPIDYSYEDQKVVVRDHIPVSSWRGQFPTCARRIGVA